MTIRWPGDGAKLESVWDVRDRLGALIDPMASLRIRAIWLFSQWMVRRAR